MPTGGDRPLLEVGRIERAHGLRGDVVVRLVTNVTDRLRPGSVLQAPDRGLEVVSSRPHQQRWIVHFAGVDDREAADGLRHLVLRAPALDGEDDDLWAHDLIGRRVVDAGDVDRGVVEALQDNPAADLLVLDSGALVPLTFVVDVAGDGPIRVDVPDGLFDL